MKNAIGLRDLEEAIHDVFEHARFAGEDARDLFRVDLEARGVLARKIEDAPDIGFLLGRRPEGLLKRLHFFFGDDTIGLCHLCRERDDGDGEHRARIGALLQPFHEEQARDRVHQRADRPADQEARNGVSQFSPDGHKVED